MFMQSGSSIDNGYMGMFTPSICPEGQINGSRQLQYQQLWHCDELHQSVWGRAEDNSNFVTPANSLLSYDSSTNLGNQRFNDESITFSFPFYCFNIDEYGTPFVSPQICFLHLMCKLLQGKRFTKKFNMTEMNSQMQTNFTLLCWHSLSALKSAENGAVKESRRFPSWVCIYIYPIYQ